MSSKIFILMMGVPISFGGLLLFCTVGSATTENFILFSDAAYDSSWYRLPVKMQTYVLLLIVEGQQECVFQGLGILDLNLISFSKVSFFVDINIGAVIKHCWFSR